MKKLLHILALILSVSMLCTLFACGSDPQEQQKEEPPKHEPNAKVVALAGDYLLDGTDYGMPMSWYIKIGQTEDFKISTKRDFSVDKGNGQVREKDGNYMFIYSDSTTESPKTCSFTVDNGNLVFDGKVYVGTASVSSEDKVVALTLAYEDKLNEYVGVLEKVSGMGGTPTTIYYNQSLTLKAGKKFHFESEFAMGPATYLYVEEGTFTIDGTSIKLKALKKITSAHIEDGELTDIAAEAIVEETGTIENGQIKINVYPSPMSSSKSETTLKVATTAHVAGTYTGSKSIQMGPMSMSFDFALTLDKVGGYTLIVGEYEEKGTFAISDTTMTFTATSAQNEGVSQDAPAAYTATLGTLSISGSLPTGGPSTQITVYHESVQGVFKADDSDNTPQDFAIAELVLNADGKFILSAGKDDANYEVVLEGTFAVSTGAMGSTAITLTATVQNGEELPESLTLTGSIGGGKINVQNVPTDLEETLVSFGFERFTK